MQRKSRNILRLSTLISVTVVIVALLFWSRPETQAELQPLAPPSVITSTVRQQDIQTMTRMVGKLQPAGRAALRFEISGNVVDRLVEPGQQVEAGDLLLQLEESDFEDAVSEARAAFEQEEDAIARDRELLELTIAKREIQEREVARFEKLGKESLASRSGLDEARALLLQHREDEARLRHSVNMADSRLKSRRSALNRAERNLERTRLKAPFAGTISSVTVEVGDYVSTGQLALELVQLAQLDLYLEVPGQLAKQLTLGQEMTVYTNEQEYHGKVFAVAPDPHPETHTHALRIRLEANGLYPGQLAEVEIPGQRFKDVEVVPVSAVMLEEGNGYVFTVEGNRIRKQPVRLLARQGDLQVIRGVAAGTTIVTRDIALLADNQEVHIE